MATARDGGARQATKGRRIGPELDHVPQEARPGAHARALRRAAAHRRPALRGAEARGAAAALRPAARDGRGAEELGGAEGAVGARGGEAARGPRRGSSHRVRRLRGRDPARQLRRRLGHRVGPRLVPLRQARGSARAARARQARGGDLRPQDARALDAGPHVGQGQGLAAPQEGGRRRGPARRGRADRAVSALGALRAHRRGDGRTPPGASPRSARASTRSRRPRGEVSARRQPFTLATLAERPFSDPAWLFEIKYDGVRVLASRRGDRVELYGRSGQDTTSRYPEVVRALRALPVDSLRDRRGDRGPRRRGAAELSAAAAAHGAHRSARDRADGRCSAPRSACSSTA